MPWFRRALVWFFRRVVSIYFRDVEVDGASPSPDVGGRVFVSNHVNGLIDPILVLTAAPCPISPVAKSTLWKMPVLRWLLDAVDAVPLVRRRDDPTKASGSNEEVFDRVASWLTRGGNVLIFPEGTSHNEPHVIEVRTGAARMLARAFRRGASDATFQAVALEFEARDKFRSRVLVVYGPVHAVETFAKGGASDQEIVSAITGRIQEDLSDLVVEGATWPERVLIARVAEMVTNDEGPRTFARWNEIGRQVESARKALAGVGEERVRAVHEAVDAYWEALEREELRDEQIAPGAAAPAATDLPGRLAVLVIGLPFALLGVIAYWLPYQLPRLAAGRIANDPDEVSTYKLATGLLVYPLWAAALIALAVWRLPVPAAAGTAAAILVAPFAALAWHDQARPLRRAISSARRTDRIAALRAARARAMELVRQTQAELGM